MYQFLSYHRLLALFSSLFWMAPVSVDTEQPCRQHHCSLAKLQQVSWDHCCHGMANWCLHLLALPSSCPPQSLREHSCPSVVPTSQSYIFIWSTREESLERLLERTGMATHGPFYFGVKASGGWDIMTAGAAMPSVANRVFTLNEWARPVWDTRTGLLLEQVIPSEQICSSFLPR